MEVFGRWPETEHLGHAADALKVPLVRQDGALDEGLSVSATVEICEQFVAIALSLRPMRPDMVAVATQMTAALPRLRAFRDAADPCAFLEGQPAAGPKLTRVHVRRGR
jgi:hypothetical protein